MMKASKRQDPIYSSSEQGAQWLIERQQTDGSLRGAVSLGDYYKAPFALAATGHNRECERMLDYVTRTYWQEDGDLDGKGLPWFQTFRIYPHGWLIMASMVRGRFDLAYSILRFLLTYFDERSGGFFATSKARHDQKGNQELMSTSLAGLACLWAGRLDVAERTGRWVETLFRAQPDLSRGLYHVWNSEHGLVVEVPAENAESFLVDATKPGQWYFQYGISAAFLSSLSAATGEKKWLRLAQEILRASRYCREDVYRIPRSGKIGWGAAWTYRLSHEAEDRDLAEKVAAGLISLQDPDGSWRLPSSREGESGDAIDVTSEFVALQACISLVLE